MKKPALIFGILAVAAVSLGLFFALRVVFTSQDTRKSALAPIVVEENSDAIAFRSKPLEDYPASDGTTKLPRILQIRFNKDLEPGIQVGFILTSSSEEAPEVNLSGNMGGVRAVAVDIKKVAAGYSIKILSLANRQDSIPFLQSRDWTDFLEISSTPADAGKTIAVEFEKQKMIAYDYATVDLINLFDALQNIENVSLVDPNPTLATPTPTPIPTPEPTIAPTPTPTLEPTGPTTLSFSVSFPNKIGPDRVIYADVRIRNTGNEHAAKNVILDLRELTRTGIVFDFISDYCTSAPTEGAPNAYRCVVNSLAPQAEAALYFTVTNATATRENGSIFFETQITANNLVPNEPPLIGNYSANIFPNYSDFNEDASLNLEDYKLLVERIFAEPSGENAKFDTNQDGVIDIRDIRLLTRQLL